MHESQCRKAEAVTPRRTSWAKGAALAAASLALAGCVSPGAPKTAATLNGEAMYAPRAWAESQPVNITARLNAVQSALNSVQVAANDYFAYQQQRADTFNAQQARMSEYKSRIYHRRLEEEAAERERLRALASQNRVFKIGTVNPVDGPGFNFAAHDAAWSFYNQLSISSSAMRSHRRAVGEGSLAATQPPVISKGYGSGSKRGSTDSSGN